MKLWNTKELVYRWSWAFHVARNAIFRKIQDDYQNT